MELSDIQRLYIQTIFDHFHIQGIWPTYGDVERKISQVHRDFDMRGVARSLPSGFANAFAFNIDRKQEAVLNVPAVHLCNGSERDLADFIRVLQFCVEKYFGFGEDYLQVTSDEIKEQLKLPELVIRKVGQLIEAEGGFWASFGRKDIEGNNWMCALQPGMDGIARFDKVESVEQYLAKRNQPSKISLGTQTIDIGSNFLNIAENLEKVVQADPKNIQEVAVTQLELSNSYYRSALSQSQQSFKLAFWAAVVGLLFFLAAIAFLLIHLPENIANVSLISGALIEVISGINFYLYGQASKQLAAFQIPLDRIGRFLLANSVCENLEGEIKQSTRAELVRLIMDLPIKNGKEKEIA
jgi:hypothetical protein